MQVPYTRANGYAEVLCILDCLQFGTVDVVLMCKVVPFVSNPDDLVFVRAELRQPIMLPFL